ncbi:Hypothetical protein POVR1_LOCUS397 [uncultured virus]|nr:Hypothetical protein POVR1_LOCUS397 [uncultured virus]
MSNIVAVLTFGTNDHIHAPVDLAIKRCKTGLCNQLFRLINVLVAHEPETNIIVLDVISADYQTGQVLSADTLLDLEKMNSIYHLNLQDITKNKPTHYCINNDEFIFRSCWHQPSEFAKRAKQIIFHERLIQTGRQLVEHFGLIGRLVNLVHLRVEDDMMEHVGPTAAAKILADYETQILQFCQRDLPLVLLTGCEEHELISKLRKEYSVIIASKCLALSFLNQGGERLDGREILAACDITFAQHLMVNHFIGFGEGTARMSSFTMFIRTTIAHQHYHLV